MTSAIDEEELEQEPAESLEREHGVARCPIVGIGASAGGIEALRRLLPAVEPRGGIAYVIVLHLDPAQKSHLAEILARSCQLPVTVIADDTEVEPDHVYVIPANALLTIEGSRLLLAPPAAPRSVPISIDEFFTSLARDQAQNAACVVLSGTGSDGTIGLRAIKEAGGLTVAQAEAEYDGMMRSAVATGLVDFVLGAEEIPAKLADYFRHVTRTQRNEAFDLWDSEQASFIPQVIQLLRTQTGHDFSEYKDRTIVRRVQRRMHVLQLDQPAAFIERLRQDPREINLLFQDLLIGVTSFFRDPEAFAAIQREVIPTLFLDKGRSDSIRIWVTGCATGEEAYSLAILLQEAMPQGQGVPRLQIFASDIDEHALEIARVGRYPAAIAKDVSPERLERFFQREDGTYRIGAELREICLFSAHSLLRDPPFSRQDMISCRNLLIYMRSELQARVIPLFHYSLRQNGYLFLGSSENVTRHTRLFATVNKHHRIFQRRTHAERSLPAFPLTSPSGSGRRPTARAASPQPTEPSLQSAAERLVLDRFAPAYAVINAEGDVLQSSGRTGKYLELPAGVPDTNVFSMARMSLRIDLRAALHKAVVSARPATQPSVTTASHGGQIKVNLTVQPLQFGGTVDPLYLVVFQDAGTLDTGSDPADVVSQPADPSDTARHLENELLAARERLQTTTEELESSNEELKSSNEELSSINEELQSSNEELETSKEELQSINEELQTVNAELNSRVEELSRANNDMSNLLESTQIATVFLDRGLLVKSFTPAAKDLFRLVESDAGRPILHVRQLFELETLQADAERVLRTLATIERQVKTGGSGTRYVMRVLPYRTADNVISGVVLTFTDVTRITLAEARIEELTRDLQARVRDLEALLDLVPVGVMIADAASPPNVVVNQYYARLLGAQEKHSGLRPANMAWRLFEGDREVAQQDQPLWQAASTGRPASVLDSRLVGAADQVAQVMVSAVPLLDENQAVRGAIAALVDISPHKRAAADQLVLLNELQHRVKNILATVSSLATRIGKASGSVADFQVAFLARLGAMGRIHDLLSSGAWQGADLRSLLQTALDLHANGNRDRIALKGDDVALAANVAPSLGMVFYEMATNAAKYGALSSEQGVVDVAWTLARPNGVAKRKLQLRWAERDGPKVPPGRHEGFGTAFIRRSVEYELDGALELNFAETGLLCSIDLLLDGNPAPSGTM